MRILLTGFIAVSFLAISLPLWGQGQADLIKLGQEKFNDTCAACHRTSGEGLPVKFPALKNNPLVRGDPKPVIQIVLDGRQGQLGRMPSWKDSFSDEDVAAVVSYIRQAWGNQAPPVTPEMVAKIRGK